MSALSLPVVVFAMGLASAWLTAALVFPQWTRLTRRWPAFARWSLLVSTLPTIVGMTLVMAALLPGDPHLGQLFGCHCYASMPSWLHLCPVHPHESASLVPAAALVLVLLLPGRVWALAALAREPVGRRTEQGPVVADLPAPTAIIVGWLRPTVVVDRRMWSALGPSARDAVLAHEFAHLTRRDPLMLMSLRLFASLGPVPVGDALARAWLDRAEVQADALAASSVGDPLLVAETLIRCARLGPRPQALAPAWTGGAVERRVQALLDGSAAGVAASPDVSWTDAIALAGVCAATVGCLPWLHHQIEHLLNLSL